MKNFTSIFVIVLLFNFLLSTFNCSAQWQQTNGIYGGNSYAIYNMGNRLFLGTYNNNNQPNNTVFVSDDNGSSWTAKLTGIPAGVTGFTNINSTIYCSFTYYSVDSGGVYSSIDNGENWVKMQTPPFFAFRKVISHNSDLFAFSYTGSGLHKSTNGGVSWTMISHPVIDNYPTELRFIGSTMFISFTNTNSVYSSTNSGSSWTLTTGTNLPSAGPMNSFLSIGTDLYCVISSNATYKSTNNGSSWSVVSTIASADNLYYSNGYLVYVSNGGTNMFYSTDMGVTFTNDYINHPIHDILFLNNELFLAAGEIACQKIDQFGSDIVCNTGIIASGVPILFGNKTSKLQTYIRYVGYFETTDRGQNWNSVGGFTQSFENVYVNGNFVYGCDNYLFGYQYSTDSGNSYHFIGPGNLGGYQIREICGSNDSVYVCANNGLYFSSDTGHNYTQIDNGFTPSLVNSVKVIGNKIYASTSQNVYVSSNQGVSWTVINTGLPGALTKDKLFMFDNTLYLFIHNANSFVFRYNEAGNTWVNISTGITTTNNQFYTLFKRQNQLLLGSIKGIYISANNGQSWNEISQGLIDKSIYAIYADTVNFYAGTSCAGVWKRSLTDPIFVPNVTLTNNSVNDTLCSGQSVEFVAGGAALYEFFVNGISQGASGTNSLFTTTTLITNNIVSVVGYGFAGGTDTAYNNMQVLSQNAPVVSLLSDNSNSLICPNTYLNFTASGGVNYEFFVSGISQGFSSSNTLSYSSTTNFSVNSIGYDTNNCRSISNTISYLVYNGTVPAQPSICKVTVDTISSQNIIYWDKTNYDYINIFKIYKEVTANSYIYIASVTYNSLSEYLDNSADPNVTSSKYKIMAVDSCNNESLISELHGTIKLAINQTSPGHNDLSWNAYSGTSVTTYNIYRGINANSLQYLSSTTNLTYTDNTAPTSTVYYRVAAVLNTTCATDNRSFSQTVVLVTLPEITEQPQSQTKCLGQDVTFTVQANSSFTMTYQWKKNGINIVGENNSTFPITGISQTDAANYTCAITNSQGTIESIQATLTVSIPTATITPGGATTFCDGDNVQLLASSGSGYTYEWYLDNNIILNQTLSYISATTQGSYTVKVKDGFGCINTSLAITININPLPDTAITYSTATVFCSGDSITITGVEGTYSYQWKDNGIVIQGAISNIYTADISGDYSLTLINTQTNCSATSSEVNVTVNANPVPVIQSTGSLVSCIIDTVQLSIVNIYTTYSWTGGSTNASIDVTNSGTYSLTVTDGNGCNGITSETVVENVMAAPEICIVLVDSTTGKNLIVWEKTTTVGISGYVIYKLSGLQYDALDTIPYNNLSVYVDYNSVPEIHADRYKLSVLDTCGNESNLSPYIQTISLGVSQGVPSSTMVLNWNFYEDESANFVPAWYYIYRGDSPGNLSLHDSVSSVFSSYNDPNVFSMYYYKVSVTKPFACTPTSIFKDMTGPFSQSLSNIEDNGIIINVENSTINNEFNIYPNPAKENIIITYNLIEESNVQINIFNLLGETIKTIVNNKQKQGKQQINIDIKKYNLADGVYVVSFETSKQKLVKRILIIER